MREVHEAVCSAEVIEEMVYFGRQDLKMNRVCQHTAARTIAGAGKATTSGEPMRRVYY